MERMLYVLISVFMCSGQFPLRAQELMVKQYTVNEGLPSNEVYQVAEDTSGRLLIATDRGAVYYDGYEFRFLKTDRKMKGQPVFGIYRSPFSGKTYLYGANGIFIQKQDSLYPYPYNHLVEARQANGQPVISEPVSIYSLAEKRDSMWIVFPGYGREVITDGGNRYYPDSKNGIYFDLGKRIFHKKHTAADNDAYIYITWNDGVKSKDSVSSLPLPLIKRLLHTTVGDLDVFCIYDRLLVYRNKKRIGSYRLAYPALALETFDRDKLLIGYQRNGVGLYDLTEAGPGPLLMYAVPGISVYDIFRDFQGGLWFSTLDKGLFYGHPNLFQSRHDPGEIVSVSSEGRSVAVCYRPGRIHVFEDGTLQQVIPVPLNPGEVLLDCHYLDKNNYYAITNLGVSHVRNGIRTFQTLAPFVFNPLPSTPSKRVFFADDSVFYVGYNNSLYRFDIGEEYTGDSLTIRQRLSAMVKDDEGREWLGSFNHLYLRDTGQPRMVMDKDSLLQTRIIALGRVSGGWLAIATLGSGLIMYHPLSGATHALDEKNGLPTAVLHRMDIQNDTIWLGTNKGMAAVTFLHGNFSVQVYDHTHGFPTVDIKEFCVSGGWLYFKCDDRLYTVRLDRLQKPKPAKPAKITAASVNKRPIPLSGGSFRYDERDISIDFVSINPERGRHQLYRYRLSENDLGKWYTTTERQVRFTNLSPGNYIFEVQADDATGSFTTRAAICSFTIHPPFWNTWLFYLFIVFLLLLSIFLLARRRMRMIRQRNQLLLSLAEHQQKALVQQMSPHFIYNVINTAQGAIIHGLKREALDILSRFTRLMRLSLELSREKTVSLEREIRMLEQYLALELIRFPGKFIYGIHMDPAIDPRIIRIPGMLIQPFAENAIKHGISHLSGREGCIDIRFEQKEGLIYCSVSDNGVGRIRAAKINSNRAAPHRSAGIAITIRRLELLHQVQGKSCTYTVTDKYDEQENAAGTTVVFSIPCEEHMNYEL